MNNKKYIPKKKTLTQLQKDFLIVFKAKGCDISKSTAAINIDRGTYYNWIKNPIFKKEIDNILESEKDWAESQMKTLMQGIPILDENNRIVGWQVPPNTSVLLFWAKCKMKDRGYSETVEPKVNNYYSAPITEKIIDKIYDIYDKEDGKK